MERLLYALFTLATPLLGGYGARRAALALNRGLDSLMKLSRGMKWLHAIFLGPVTAVLSLWVVDLSQIRLAALPAIGAAYHVTGALLALGAARLMRMDQRQTGAFFMAGMVSNLGSVGGLVGFLLWGEPGFALVSFYRLLELPLYYVVGYPIASMMGTGERVAVREAVRKALTEPATALPILGVAVGIALNLAGIARPQELGPFNSVLIILLSINLAFSIGLSMRVGAVAEHLPACGAMALIKYLALPPVVAGLSWLAGLQGVDGGLPFKVAVLLSFMPVGFIALIPTTLFNLDKEMANAVWLSSTLLLLAVLPLVAPLLL